MKLWYSPASPFVRKVLVLAHETGLQDEIELVPVATTVVDPDSDLAKANPVGKIPTLVTDDGMSIFDSRVICEYLDSLHDGDRMFPAEGVERFNALTTQAMGDGVLDAAVGVRYETFLRPAEKQWDKWVSSQMRKVTQSLDVLESWRGANLQDIHIGSITVACALGYLEFRQPDMDWRKGRPLLTQMYETFSKRTSMQETRPE
ncbi:MAG: glutathione S-transferase N-terminal domain-containing protein [Rhizobiaceae bacterium]|nr:glutathione S-transferase N-terminal domain-containing protein [Rhizobiaceae bacterium]